MFPLTKEKEKTINETSTTTNGITSVQDLEYGRKQGGTLRMNIEDYTVEELVAIKKELDKIYSDEIFREATSEAIAKLLIGGRNEMKGSMKLDIENLTANRKVHASP